MRKILLWVLLLLASLELQAQNEAAHWHFGGHGGLNFMSTQTRSALDGTILSGIPSLEKGYLNTVEGCFTISNSAGELLMSSDGSTVYNYLGSVILSGLGGNATSSQSGIVCPAPGYTNRYYVFGFYNSGKYAVISFDAARNATVVQAPTSLPKGVQEQITAVRHANGKDYWILYRPTTTQIAAYLLTSSGLSATPVTSSTPAIIGRFGYMKLSPDGQYLGWCMADNNNITSASYGVARFDNSTGIVSNVKSVNNSLWDPYGNYGVEFSPNSENVFFAAWAVDNFVYGSKGRSTFGVYVANVESFMASPTIPRKIGNICENIQLAPDGRIYGTASGSYYSLFVIPNPNDPVNNVIMHEVPNIFTSANRPIAGLPTFMASFFNAKATDKSFVCVGNDFKYTVEVTMSGVAADQPTILEWDFGDGSSIVTQNIVGGTTIYKQTHNYATTGKYTITITPYKVTGVALTPVTLPANVVDCVFQTNRMIRVNLLNTAQQQ